MIHLEYVVLIKKKIKLNFFLIILTHNLYYLQYMFLVTLLIQNCLIYLYFKVITSSFE